MPMPRILSLPLRLLVVLAVVTVTAVAAFSLASSSSSFRAGSPAPPPHGRTGRRHRRWCRFRLVRTRDDRYAAVDAGRRYRGRGSGKVWSSSSLSSSLAGGGAIPAPTRTSSSFQEHRVVVPASSSPDDPSLTATLQVLTQRPISNHQLPSKPILLFLHGSFHGAWCYDEHWFDYFCDLGYPVAALSWRGTGGSPAVPPGTTKVQMSIHVQDLRHVLQQLPSLVFSDDANGDGNGRQRGVVLVSHSFGGLTVMKLLEEHPDQLLSMPENQEGTFPPIIIKAIVTMCSVPPSGNGPMTMRYLRKSLTQSWKITAGFAMKKCCTDMNLCRDLFFSSGRDDDNDDNDASSTVVVSDDDLARYQSYFRRDSEATIDLLDLAKKLPSKLVNKDTGAAPYVNQLPPCLVMGASRDYIVDRVGVVETATYFGVNEEDVVTVESPHDVMLGNEWRNGADAVANFLQKNGL